MATEMGMGMEMAMATEMATEMETAKAVRAARVMAMATIPVCAGRGESCVENGCWDATAIGGQSDICPGPGEYGVTVQVACDEPLPAPLAPGDVYDCCCV